MKVNIKLLVIWGLAIFAISGMIFAGVIMNAQNKELESTLIRTEFVDLQKMIEDKESFILVYTADTCANCQTYKTKLQRILLENNLVAYEVESSDYSEPAQQALLNSIASISGTPTTVFIEDGEEVSTSLRVVGDKTTTDIEEALTKAGYLK